MTVLFVLMIFAAFLALDAWSHRREAALEPIAVRVAEPESLAYEPVWVGGYQVPDGFHFHRGHTWVRPLDAETAVVGIDDFARRLIGRATRAELPQPGEWVATGARAAALGHDERDATLVSPVEGQVVEVNPLLESDPGVATRDPYGRGWLYKVRTSELGRNLRNLFSGSLAHRLVEDSRERLHRELMALSGSVLADGGEPSVDYPAHLSDEEWRRLADEFLIG